MIGVESSRVMRAAPRKAAERVEASVPWDFSRKYAAVHHSGTISVENARKRSKIGRVMKVETFETPQDAAKALAGEVAELIRTRAAEGKNVVLGLATGATPLPFYAELVRMHKEEGLSFANVISFNLDEYSGLDRDHPESYWYFMHTNLFNHIDIKPENINLPSGTVKDDEIAAHCAAYEQKIKDCGGIDLQILGIGRTGHIGFNEPGSDDTTVTRQVHLDELTRSDAAPAFGGGFDGLGRKEGVHREKSCSGACDGGCGRLLPSEASERQVPSGQGGCFPPLILRFTEMPSFPVSWKGGVFYGMKEGGSFFFPWRLYGKCRLCRQKGGVEAGQGGFCIIVC